jgi:hypothetical protein
MPEGPQCWKIYALGGGLGHFNRALSLGRSAITQGHSVEILTNSRFAPHIPWKAELGESGDVTFIRSEDSPEATSVAVSKWLMSEEYDRLIIDTFPRGLAGELPELMPEVTVPKTLIHRDLNPEYIEKYDVLGTVEQFDQLILPGEDAPFANIPNASRTEPWFIRDPQELLPADHARLQLGMETDDPRRLLLVCSTGRAEEEKQFKAIIDELKRSLDDWCVRLASPIPGAAELTVWPLLPLLNGVDALVGAGGYNLVNEARATGTPLFAFAQERRYDRQHVRLAQDECVSDVFGILSGLGSLRESSQSGPFVNGVHQAVDWIEAGY